MALKTQPDYIKFGQLRDFQIKGINFLIYNWCNGKNVILAGLSLTSPLCF